MHFTVVQQKIHCSTAAQPTSELCYKMSILQDDDTQTDVEHHKHEKHNSSIKSVSFAPIESTRIDADDFDSDLSDSGYSDARGFKEKKTVRICEGENDMNGSENNGTISNIIVDKHLSETPTRHEKSKTKTENKVTFCDTPNDIASSPEPAGATQTSPSSPTSYSEIIITSEPSPGIWPLKRSASLESRDNPFQPDGDLSKEADDLLKRATIIRDRFYLNERNELVDANDIESAVTLNESSPDKCEASRGLIQEGSISPVKANESHSAPNDKPKQNGKIEESTVSPDSVKVDTGSEKADITANHDGTIKDKKKQKKCCSVM